MAKVVLLQSQKGKNEPINILPITRGELVLDSSGNQAFRSEEFLANGTQPGLFKYENVKDETAEGQEGTQTEPQEQAESKKQVIQILAAKPQSETSQPVVLYPKVIAKAIEDPENIVISVTGNEKVNAENTVNYSENKSLHDIFTLDARPTEKSYTSLVSSGGVYDELKETVGNIQILLKTL